MMMMMMVLGKSNIKVSEKYCRAPVPCNESNRSIIGLVGKVFVNGPEDRVQTQVVSY